MKNNSFGPLVRTLSGGGRIRAFRQFCAAAVAVFLFSGLGVAQNGPATTITGGGTADFIPRWTGPTTLGNSNIFETVGGNVGIATTTPAAKLDVKGTGAFRDTLILVPKLTHPTLSVNGTAFAVSNTGQVTFVSGQTFPGTITGVTAGTDLTGGGNSGSVTLNVDTTKVPQLGTANTFTGNQSVTGNVSASGQVQGAAVNATTSFNFGGSPFAFAGANGSTFFGFAGNSTSTGTDNTATGAGALSSNTTGGGTVAYGQAALFHNTTGYDNAAFGTNALVSSTTGYYNSAIGVDSLYSNTTGYENTAVGMLALSSNTTGNDLTCVGFNCTAAGKNLHNATAIGAHATVKVSNALVLGSISGVNGAKATTMVGIGTNSPTNLLTLGQGFGPSIGDGWATYSSRRWKTNIQPLHNALGMVERLRGVSYDMKDSGKHEIGVIAEEVGAVIPEVVSYEENGKDARGVDYSRLTALLIEATKQQQGQIRQQQSILRTQATAIRELKSELRATRQTLQKVQADVAATQPALVAAK